MDNWNIWLLVCNVFFSIDWESSSQLTNSYFSEGLKPPTRIGSFCVFFFVCVGFLTDVCFVLFFFFKICFLTGLVLFF